MRSYLVISIHWDVSCSFPCHRVRVWKISPSSRMSNTLSPSLPAKVGTYESSDPNDGVPGNAAKRTSKLKVFLSQQIVNNLLRNFVSFEFDFLSVKKLQEYKTYEWDDFLSQNSPESVQWVVVRSLWCQLCHMNLSELREFEKVPTRNIHTLCPTKRCENWLNIK